MLRIDPGTCVLTDLYSRLFCMCVCNGGGVIKNMLTKLITSNSTKVLVQEGEDLHPHPCPFLVPFFLCNHQEAHFE